jgi:Skp family chaperone for outer membrane proteins
MTKPEKKIPVNILSTMIIIGPLLLSAALTQTAQAETNSGSSAPVRVATVSESTTDRDSYAQKASDDVRDWQQKLHDFSQQAEAKGKDADKAAKRDLDEAWRKTEAASRKLQTASNEGWVKAKREYEEASRELTQSWNKIRPEHN